METTRARVVWQLERERVRAEARARLFGGQAEPLRVARFELRRRVGEGASAWVYAAYDPQLEREVALKLLTLEGDAEARSLAEARALARISHPNVLPVFDAGVVGDLSYIVSELVDGGTLRQWSATPRAPRERLRVLVEAGRGLAAGHAGGLVHRDVKPENVLLGPEGRPRVADFGLAASVEMSDALVSDSGGVSGLVPGASARRPLLGTLRYMAPEQLAGERADAKSDQFGFCVMGWELLTGAAPFRGAVASELLASIRGTRLEAPRVPGLGRALEVLRRGLAVEPERRFPDMTALCDALEPRRSRWPLAAGLSAALVGAGALAVSLALREAPLEVGPAAAAAARERERAVGVEASRLAQSGRAAECARFLSTRATTDGLVLLWLGCARLVDDPAELTRACAAWRAQPRSESGDAALDACQPAVLAAKARLFAGDPRGCAEALLAAEPSPLGSITLATCVNRAQDKGLYARQCRYQLRLAGRPASDEQQCERAW